MKERLEGYIKEALKELGITAVDFVVEHPADMAYGDWATNFAMTLFASLRASVIKDAKIHFPENLGKPRNVHQAISKNVGGVQKEFSSPREYAEQIKTIIDGKNYPDILSIDVAGPGFINFKIASAVFDKELSVAISKGDKWGWNDTLKGKKVMVEYTDPNPFKEFHIGHLMSNAIGESISRLVEANGAEVRRACYQGDVGLHVAKALYDWVKKGKFIDFGELSVGISYANGDAAYRNDLKAKEEIEKINKQIYASFFDKSIEGGDIPAYYRRARGMSLDYFETIYKRLDTTFDEFFFESETGETGKKIVLENKGKVFEESEGAIVFRAEKFNPKLHTRVFINKDGLPTYEAKELGLAKIKYEKFPYDISIVVTGNEVNDYFLVLFEAMRQVFPGLAKKTEHYSHGMLRLPTGKMSSRTGDVITATWLLDEAKARIMKNVKGVAEDVAEAAGVAAVKYSILRQTAGRDIIFDFDRSLSFEGDSGPYLQYTYARTWSVLEKAGNARRSADVPHNDYGSLTKLLTRFPELVLRASLEREPHHVANYLIEVAHDFNSFYGSTMIVDGGADQPYKLALTEATGLTLKNGLRLLGITAPDKM
ncbi:MAG: arginine--tRNA ligase [Patescibacteria group bacterium]